MGISRWARIAASFAGVVVVLVACGGTVAPGPDLPAPGPDLPAPAPTLPAPRPAPAPEAAIPAPLAPPAPAPDTPRRQSAAPRPAWLGTRPLPLGSNGFGEVAPTPPELDDRRLITLDLLAPPADDRFASTVVAVPDDVAARSTWKPECPVTLGDLRYVTVSFWGFDGRPHTGELLVHAEVADGVVEVFRQLHEARFPIEEMRVTRADELVRPPTGDDNNTGSFVCRPSRGTASWSQHAYGRAVDINPFHNPYVKGEVVLPELAASYRDRSRVRPGMVVAGDVVSTAFADLDWGWGGTWRSSNDPMHFSENGR